LRPGLKGGQLKLLTEDQLYDIHLAVLRLLNEHGVKIQNEKALKLLDEAGAKVDFKGYVAKFPEYLVKECIGKTPKCVRLCGRDPKEDFVVEGRKVYFGTAAGAPYISDLETRERRIGKLVDIINVAKVIDALPNIDYAMGITSASDVPKSVIGLYEAYATLANTCKHVQAFCYADGRLTDALIRIAELVVGGRNELKKRPIISLYDEPSSPLIFGDDFVDGLMKWSEAGLPLIWAPCIISGATSPITIVGSVVQGIAESIAGNIISQLVNPGTPFIFGLVPLSLDMRSGLASYGKAECMIMEIILGQMSEFYGTPSFGTGGITDSKVLDEQAVAEATMQLTIASLSGNNLIHDVAFLESAKSGSVELLIICDEIIAMLRRIMRGIDINDETLAVEAIKEAGHGGSFLSLRHTLKHFTSEYFLSELMDRSTWTKWKKDGGKTLGQRAREKARRILKEHEVEPLSKDVKQEIEKIIRKTEKAVTKKHK